MVTEPAEVPPYVAYRICVQPLIASKGVMNPFQRTYSLTCRKFCVFESALIHRRTHLRCLKRGVPNVGDFKTIQLFRLHWASLSGDKDADPELPLWAHPQPLATRLQETTSR